MTATTMPRPSEWTVQSTVEAGVRLGLAHFTAFFVVALLFTLPAFALKMNGIGGVPKAIADMIGTSAAQICILCGVFQALDEHPIGTQATLWQINRPDLAGLLLAGSAQALVVAVGAFFLVVPGLYLMTLFAFVLPVMLIEDLEMVDAFRHSAELTRGRRWRVFGTIAACFAGAFIVFAVVALILSAIPILNERIELLSMAQWLAGAAIQTFFYPVSAILYVLLRQEKEGLSVHQIAGTLH
jgi:hypothetical protein